MKDKMIISEAARHIAIEAHGNQQNPHDGQLYLNHVQRVVNGSRYTARLFNRANGVEVFEAIAWLHDVVEDTDFTIETLHDRMSADAWDCPVNPIWNIDYIIKAVDLLTKIPNEPNIDYYTRILKISVEGMAGQGARIVKLADLIDNFRRVHKVEDEATRTRLSKKYSLGMDMLMPW